jgi:hypothetical protein
VANEAAQFAGTGQKRTLRPITAGMRRPTQTAELIESSVAKRAGTPDEVGSSADQRF